MSVLAVLLAGAGGTGVYFALGEVDRVKTEVTKLRGEHDEFVRKERRSQNLARVDRDLIDLVDEAGRRSLNASDEGIIDFLDEIESNAKSAGVKLEANSPDMPADRSRLRMQVSVSGSWESVHRFISIIEHLPYAMDLTSVAVGASDQASPLARSYRAQVTFAILSVKVPPLE